ncbi:MAG: hypothetical protein PHQ77_05550 [Proteiniphilum sp.]|nr:hypothetical protein [Proteiniphilum sp.]
MVLYVTGDIACYIKPVILGKETVRAIAPISTVRLNGMKRKNHGTVLVTALTLGVMGRY